MANPLYEYNATLGPAPGGSQRDLLDSITVVDAKETPFFAMCPKGTAQTNVLFEWPVDKELAADDNAQKDGTDVTHSNTAADSDFDSATDDYAVLSNRCQWFRRQALVGKLAQDVQNQAGVKDKYAYAVTKKLLQLRRDIETRMCSDHLYSSGPTLLYDADVRTSSASTAMRTRGLGAFINSSTSGIDSDFRTPAASITGSGSASTTIDEDAVDGVLQSRYEQTGTVKTLTLLAGPTLKTQFKNMTKVASGTNEYSTTRTYNADLSGKKIINTVDIYEGDFGTLELIPSLWLRYNFSSGLESAAAQINTSAWKGTGYVIDWDLVEMRFNQQPQVMPLQDNGGGKRFCVDAIAGLCVKNPLALGKFNYDS